MAVSGDPAGRQPASMPDAHSIASAAGGRPNSPRPNIVSARSGSLIACTRPACASRQNRWIGVPIRRARPPGVLEQQVHGADGLPGAAHLIAPDPQPQRHRDRLARPGVRHQLGHVPLERGPRRVDLGRRLGDPRLGERVLGHLVAGVSGAHPGALIFHVRLVGTRRHPDHRRGDRVGEHRAERDPVQRRTR